MVVVVVVRPGPYTLEREGTWSLEREVEVAGSQHWCGEVGGGGGGGEAAGYIHAREVRWPGPRWTLCAQAGGWWKWR